MSAQKAVTIPPAFEGVFQSIPDEARTHGGLRNSGTPEDLVLLPQALEQQKSQEPEEDPVRMCQPVGPFRMMARQGIKIELVPVTAQQTIVMLFEDVARGYIRSIPLQRVPQGEQEPAWQGYSSGRWDASTLVVETTGFNDRTWLNSKGARHSDDLRVIERIRPIEGGQYLEFKVTAEDPAVLARPFTYVRYFQRIRGEIGEYVCQVTPEPVHD
jgi:hypothetical protein